MNIGAPTIAWLVKHLQAGSTILELGSGAGTKVLSRTWKMWSVEHDPKWLNRCRSTTYIHAPIVDGWYDLEILAAQLPKKYDLLLIDGPPGRQRPGVIGHLEALFNLQVPVVVDDVHRKGDMRIAKAIAEITGRELTTLPSDYRRRFAII
jgi:predicted O-methyltransferase YrrM